MDLTIRKLKVFMTIAQMGSFTDAAKMFHLTSAALSLMVKSLEEEIGFKLFDRTTRSVRLTPAGTSLMPYAQQMLSEHRNLTQAMHAIGQKNAGLVRVASTQALSCTLVPPANTRFQEAWPNIKVVPVDALAHRVHELLLRGEADIGIGPERPCDDDIVARELFQVQLHVACSIRHRFARQAAVRWSDLADEHLLVVDRNTVPMLARDSHYQVALEKHTEVGHFSTALALANENTGVVVCANYVRKLIRPYDLMILPLIDPVPVRKVMLFQNRRFNMSPASQRYADHLASTLPQLECAYRPAESARPCGLALAA